MNVSDLLPFIPFTCIESAHCNLVFFFFEEKKERVKIILNLYWTRDIALRRLKSQAQCVKAVGKFLTVTKQKHTWLQ